MMWYKRPRRRRKNTALIGRLREMLMIHEGLRLKPYKDTVGKLTIGVGRNLDDVGISKHEAFFLLDNDIENSIAELRTTFDWFDNLDLERKAVIVNMHFNLGLGRLLGFRHMLEAVAAELYEDAARHMLDSKWADQVGNRAVELAEIMAGRSF